MAEHEQLAVYDVGGSRFDDGVFVGQARRRLGEQRRELIRRPERGQIEAVAPELQHVDVPFELEFADAVVRNRERLRSRIRGQIEVVTLDRDQMVTVGLDNAERNVQTLGLFDRLVAGDDPTVAIDHHGAARAELTQRALERRATTIGAAIGVVGISLEINEPKRMTDGSCGPGHSLRLSGAIAPRNGWMRCRAGADSEPQTAGENNDQKPASEKMQTRLLTPLKIARSKNAKS